MAEKANEALLDAADRGCLQGVKAALKAGADIDYTQPGAGLTGTGTALYIASFMGHVNVVRLLIRKGASVTKKSIGISCAPLHGAAIRGSTEVVELLVHHGATVDTRDAFQRTPIMMACLFKHVDTVRRLIEFGARVDLRDCGPVSVLGYCEVDAGAEVCVCAHDRTMKLIQEAMETKLLRCCNPTCGKPGYRSTLKLCGRCKLTRYCSRDCQKQHWSVGHKKSCGHDTYTGDEPTVFEGAVMTAKWGDLVKPLPTNCTC